MFTVHDISSDSTGSDSEPVLDTAKFVMVKRRKLWWPAKVIEVNGSTFVVRTYEKGSPVVTLKQNETTELTSSTVPGDLLPSIKPLLLLLSSRIKLMFFILPSILHNILSSF